MLPGEYSADCKWFETPATMQWVWHQTATGFIAILPGGAGARV